MFGGSLFLVWTSFVIGICLLVSNGNRASNMCQSGQPNDQACLGQAKSLLAAKAEDRKVQQLAGIFREARFMERYENEAQAREQRRRQLAKHW